MNTGFNQETARIYQFPVGGRSGLASSIGGRRQDEIRRDLELARVAQIAVGGAWYHDEAIQESEESEPARDR
jgi:hypothetical protein